MRRWHRLAVEDACDKCYQGSRQSSFDCPNGVMQAILRIGGVGTETKQQQVQHFKADNLLKQRTARPEVVFGDLEAAEVNAGCTDDLQQKEQCRSSDTETNRY